MKLCSGKEVHPFLRVFGAEDMEICFNLLIGLLCLSINLRVICGGEFDIIVKELGYFSSEGGCKLWTSIGYQGVMESNPFEHMVEEKFGNSSCINGFRARDENYPLCKAMVDHNH